MTSEIEPPFQPDAALEDEQSFGVNSAQVRLFLGQLEDLDLDRAIDVWNGYGVAEADGYAAALEEAQRLGEKQRPDAWRLAREGAADIARERLGDPDFTGEIVEVLANVAGALVVRDLLSRHDFRLLQLPWTRRGDAAAAFSPFVAHGGPRPAQQRPRLLLPIAGAIAALIVIAIVLAAVNVRGPVTGILGTNQPTSSLTAVIDPSAGASGSDAPSASSLASSVPGRSQPPKPTAPPGGGPTPAPSAPTPVVTPAPTPPPPPAKCAVVSLLDISTVKAQARWHRAGFSGRVVFAPDTPPNYKIVWQSLKIGAKVLCSSNITVSNVPPPGA